MRVLWHVCIPPGALDDVFVTHVVPNEAAIIRLHGGVCEEDEGVVVLQDAVITISRHVDVVQRLHLIVVVYRFTPI
jgi:hypothetical protein